MRGRDLLSPEGLWRASEGQRRDDAANGLASRPLTLYVDVQCDASGFRGWVLFDGVRPEHVRPLMDIGCMPLVPERQPTIRQRAVVDGRLDLVPMTGPQVGRLLWGMRMTVWDMNRELLRVGDVAEELGAELGHAVLLDSVAGHKGGRLDFPWDQKAYVLWLGHMDEADENAKRARKAVRR